MRIVHNLSEITECPNCGSVHLYTVEDRFAFSKYFKCGDCHEEIYEGNIKGANEETARRAQEEKDKFLLTLREEINDLRVSIHDTHSMTLINRLTDIFTMIADYIEEN